MTTSVAPPGQRDLVVARGADDLREIVALSAVHVDRDRAGDAERHRRRVRTAERLHDEVVERRLAAGDTGLRTEAGGHRHPSGLAKPTLSGPSVPLAITVSAVLSPVPSKALRSASTVFRSVPARSSTVSVSAPPKVRTMARSIPAKSIEIAATSRVRRTREPFGGQLDPLADVGAVEGKQITASLALDNVAAVTGIPLNVSSPAPNCTTISADVPISEVIALPTNQRVRAARADQRVVAGSAVEGDRLVRGTGLRSGRCGAGRRRRRRRRLPP